MVQSSGDHLTPNTDFKQKETCRLERREGTSPTSPHNLRAEPAQNAQFLLRSEHFILESMRFLVAENRTGSPGSRMRKKPRPGSPCVSPAPLQPWEPRGSASPPSTSPPPPRAPLRAPLRGLAATSGSNNICNFRRISKFCQVV